MTPAGDAAAAWVTDRGQLAGVARRRQESARRRLDADVERIVPAYPPRSMGPVPVPVAGHLQLQVRPRGMPALLCSLPSLGVGGRLRRFSGNIVYHEDAEDWAALIYCGPDSRWWDPGADLQQPVQLAVVHRVSLATGS